MNLKVFTNCDILGGYGVSGIKIDVEYTEMRALFGQIVKTIILHTCIVHDGV